MAMLAFTPGELVGEDDAMAVLGPSWPWGSSPVEGVGAAEDAVTVEDFEDEVVVEARENLSFLLSPPHLEDPLILLKIPG